MRHLLLAALLSAAATPALAAEAKRGTFGRMDGRPVASVTLSNGRGVSTTIIALGASIQALTMPDRDGRRDDGNYTPICWTTSDG